MSTHHYTNGEFQFRIKPRNGCTSWDVWPVGPGVAVAMGFESKRAAIAWLDEQIAHLTTA
jgi:hypothetical protein